MHHKPTVMAYWLSFRDGYTGFLMNGHNMSYQLYVLEMTLEMILRLILLSHEVIITLCTVLQSSRVEVQYVRTVIERCLKSY